MKAETLVHTEDTAADADVFAGTEIDQPYADGIGYYWVASSVNTATIEVPQFGHQAAVTNLIPKRADGIPSISDEVPFIIPIMKGRRPVVALGGTTGTVHHVLRVVYN